MNERDKIFLEIPGNFYGSYNGTHIRWQDHIGNNILLIKDGINYDINIKNVQNGVITFSYNNKNINITVTRMNQIIKEQYNNGFCNGGKLIYLIDQYTLLGNNGHNVVIHFKYKIGQRIIGNNIDYVITGFFVKPDKKSMRKIYNIHCNICGWDGIIGEKSIDNNCRCACCSNMVTVKGINDIATTDEWSIPYFINKEDIYKYHRGSFHKVNMICPFCKTEYQNITIRNFFNNINRLDCPCNSSYKSYGERFIFSLFKELNINIKTQLSRKDFIWCKNFRYDFYLPDYDIIIEVNGIQHYNGSFEKISKRSFTQEQENDINKVLLAIKNNIEHYIILDCRFSNIDYIKNSIMSSALPFIIGFTQEQINWEECNKKATSNLIKDVCELYMNNNDLNKYDFAEMFGVKPLTILSYLKRGQKLGFCDYQAYSEKGLKFGKRKIL